MGCGRWRKGRLRGDMMGPSSGQLALRISIDSRDKQSFGIYSLLHEDGFESGYALIT